jgi:uncharacterized protein YPO0396
MNDIEVALYPEPFGLMEAAGQTGFRLDRFEVYNWGTFHNRVWGLDLDGNNALLTGEIGSGKSTLVDAVTTLLVPPHRITYNKAAGAEARERTLRSYVLGHYRTERGEVGLAAKPVALRDPAAYSVILGRFRNEAQRRRVTLAQVFWFKDTQGQPARLYVVADAGLSIAEHFAGFGTDIAGLRRRLRGNAAVEMYDSFPPYAAAYRRRFGIDNEQALDLFYQTVSMKTVGNLTEFVRQHMLEAFPVGPRIDALIGHFDDLNRAHEAVLKAKDQIARLVPLVADCDEHRTLAAEAEALRRCRDALRPWFASHKAELLRRRFDHLDQEIARLSARISSLVERQNGQRAQRDDIRQAIQAQGGDRIERIKQQIEKAEAEKTERRRRAEQYDALAHSVGLAAASDDEGFLANRRALAVEQRTVEDRLAETQNALTEGGVAFRQLQSHHDELTAELRSLRQRRSNIPRRMLDLRRALCRASGVAEEALPFVGELLQVRPEERDWGGAIERVLHNFGLSILVADTDYARIAEWVDRTHLGERLVYYRVRQKGSADHAGLSPASLVRKIAVKPDSAFYGWLEAELLRRFDYICCETIDQFRREQRALTRAGQIKTGGERHEKDDRHPIDDPSRFVLGWSNQDKIRALEREAYTAERRMQQEAIRIAALEERRKVLQTRLGDVQKLAVFESFRDLDWRPLASEIERLESERRQLEQESDVLRTLERQLAELDAAIAATEEALDKNRAERARAEERRRQAADLLADCEALLTALPGEASAQLFPRLEQMRAEMPGAPVLTVESCDSRERDMRDWLQGRIDAEDHKLRRLVEKIVKAMEAYRRDYPLETQEAEASVAADGEYRAMLARLAADDLPRFEARFKELLNENTIREVANFQSQLSRERQLVRERIDRINRSLHEIDYNPGRYIVLEAALSADPEIRDFQQDLRACTEGSLTGSEEETYSEAKFLQVRRIIERFRGRDGTAELDRRWTQKVTDIRNWFAFSAAERWREDDREHEHYTDSGGKSGGQKEKLAYTVLAASLAYQFGLDIGRPNPRSFRFVVIDEAFGRGSDDSARYGLELFQRLGLQLLVVTPLQKIHIIEPYVANVGFVHNEDGRLSLLRNLSIEEYRAERAARRA